MQLTWAVHVSILDRPGFLEDCRSDCCETGEWPTTVTAVGLVVFGRSDTVRRGLCAAILRACNCARKHSTDGPAVSLVGRLVGKIEGPGALERGGGGAQGELDGS